MGTIRHTQITVGCCWITVGRIQYLGSLIQVRKIKCYCSAPVLPTPASPAPVPPFPPGPAPLLPASPACCFCPSSSCSSSCCPVPSGSVPPLPPAPPLPIAPALIFLLRLLFLLLFLCPSPSSCFSPSFYFCSDLAPALPPPTPLAPPPTSPHPPTPTIYPIPTPSWPKTPLLLIGISDRSESPAVCARTQGIYEKAWSCCHLTARVFMKIDHGGE